VSRRCVGASRRCVGAPRRCVNASRRCVGASCRCVVASRRVAAWRVGAWAHRVVASSARRGVGVAAIAFSRRGIVASWRGGVGVSWRRCVAASLPRRFAVSLCRCRGCSGLFCCSVVWLLRVCWCSGWHFRVSDRSLFVLCYVIVAALAAASPALGQPKHPLFRLVLWRDTHENKVMDCLEFHAALVQPQHGVSRTRLPPDRAAPSKRTRPFPLSVL
jgi:hypothetical protein